MFGCYIQSYPWDLLDEGLEVVLDRLCGQVGATGLSVVMVCDEVEQLRPHSKAEPRVYRTAGGAFFKPTPNSYRATCLKPPVWEQHRKVDALSKISRACHERGQDLRAVISPFHSRRLASKHPHVACKNAYDVLSRSALCLADGEVQEYIRSLVKDLSSYDGISAIVLDDVQWPAATDILPYMSARAILGDVAANLLNICFSESSLRAARADGVDGEAALRATRELLDQVCTQGRASEEQLARSLEKHPAIARYFEWSETIFLELLQDIQQASAKPIVLGFSGGNQRFLDRESTPEMLGLAEGVLIDAEDLENVIESLNRGETLQGVLTPASVAKMELLVAIDEGVVDDAPEMVRQISGAADAGAAGVTIAHYGAILENQFEWIRQALRHARRLAET